MAVRKGINGYSLTEPDPNFLFVRIIGKDFPNSVIVGCVYIPVHTNKERRTEVRNKMLHIADGLCNRFPLATVVLAGDFNTRGSRLAEKLGKKHCKLSICNIVGTSGSALTFHRNGKPVSDIDHILAYPTDGFVGHTMRQIITL